MSVSEVLDEISVHYQLYNWTVMRLPRDKTFFTYISSKINFLPFEEERVPVIGDTCKQSIPL